MKLQRIMQFCLWLGLALGAFLPFKAAWALVGTPVASVSLAVGPVFRQTGTAAPHRVQMGQALFEGDRLLTGSDAMALVVFTDDARVSLRADSEIKIVRYRAAQGSLPADLRLDLVRGAMRQISGSAMKLQPERYRLNTPVASIGVRGTDFLAKVSESIVETFIQEGSIVLLPLANGCASAIDSRHCNPIAVLSDTDTMRYVSLTAAGELDKRGVQPQELERLFGIRMARAPTAVVIAMPQSSGGQPQAKTTNSVEAPSAASPTASSASVAQPTSAVDLASARASETLQEKTPLVADGASGTPIEQPPPVVIGPPVVQPPPVVIDPPVVQPPTVVDPPAPVVLPTQLVWGRFSAASELPFKLPLSFEEASDGRHPTVGEIGQYALWRQGPNGPLDTNLRGSLSYNLAAGEASFQALGASTISAAELKDATLSIDFDRSAFSSSFSVFHAATGDIQIAASGKLNDEGLFTAVNGTTRVAGAVSRDGQEAGALFSKDVSAGTVRGISLWRARP